MHFQISALTRWTSLVAITACLMMSACEKTVQCQDTTADILITGLDSADVAGMSVTGYYPDGQFDSVIIEYRWSLGEPGFKVIDGKVEIEDFLGPQPLCDYEILMPAISKTYRITNIKREDREMTYRSWNKKLPICYNHILSYDLNGSTYTPVQQDDQTIVIEK